MKKENLIRNVCAITLLATSVAETIVMGVFGGARLGMLAFLQVFSIIGVCFVRFPRQIAQVRNWWYAYRYKDSMDDFDEEPSKFAIYIVKYLGYFLLLLAAIVYPVLYL